MRKAFRAFAVAAPLTFASAAADPAPPETPVDPAAHYLPEGARDGGFRYEGLKLAIQYTTDMAVRDAVNFETKELRKDGWHVEWCSGKSDAKFCAITGSGKDAGYMTASLKDGAVLVLMLLQKTPAAP